MRGQAEIKQPAQPDLEVGDLEEKEGPSIWRKYKPWFLAIGAGVTVIGGFVGLLLSKRSAGGAGITDSRGLIPSSGNTNKGLTLPSSNSMTSISTSAVGQSTSPNSPSDLSNYESLDSLNLLPQRSFGARLGGRNRFDPLSLVERTPEPTEATSELHGVDDGEEVIDLDETTHTAAEDSDDSVNAGAGNNNDSNVNGENEVAGDDDVIEVNTDDYRVPRESTERSGPNRRLLSEDFSFSRQIISNQRWEVGVEYSLPLNLTDIILHPNPDQTTLAVTLKINGQPADTENWIQVTPTFHSVGEVAFSDPSLADSFPRDVTGLIVKEDHVFTSAYSGVYAIDTSDKTTPTKTSQLRLGSPDGIVENDQYLYVLEGYGVQVVDKANLHNMQEKGLWLDNSASWARNLFNEGSYVYLHIYKTGFIVVNATDPDNPYQVGINADYADTSTVYTMQKCGPYICAGGAFSNSPFAIYDVRDVKDPKMFFRSEERPELMVMKNLVKSRSGNDLYSTNNRRHNTDVRRGLSTIALNNFVNPEIVAHIDSEGQFEATAKIPNYLLISEKEFEFIIQEGQADTVGTVNIKLASLRNESHPVIVYSCPLNETISKMDVNGPYLYVGKYPYYGSYNYPGSSTLEIIDLNQWVFKVNPKPGMNGNMNVTLTVHDSNGDYIEQTFQAEIYTTFTAQNYEGSYTYTEDTPFALSENPITISTEKPDPVNADLYVVPPQMGSLSTGSAGGLVSTYDQQTGRWQASGDVAHVNELLSQVVFQPAENENRDFRISVVLSDHKHNIPGEIEMHGIAVDDRPILNQEVTLPEQCVYIGQNGTYTFPEATFIEVDGEGISNYHYTVDNPSARTFIQLEGRTFTIIPTTGTQGDYELAIFANDGHSDSLESAPLRVIIPNRDPYLRKPLSDRTFFVGVEEQIDAGKTFGDDDGDEITVSFVRTDELPLSPEMHAQTGGNILNVRASKEMIGNLGIRAIGTDPYPYNARAHDDLNVLIKPSLSATETDQNIHYVRNNLVEFDPIGIIDLATNEIGVKFTVADLAAGTFTTPSSRMVVSSYNKQTGVFQVFGNREDVEAILKKLQLKLSQDYIERFLIEICIYDNINPDITGSVSLQQERIANDPPYLISAIGNVEVEVGKPLSKSLFGIFGDGNGDKVYTACYVFEDNQLKPLNTTGFLEYCSDTEEFSGMPPLGYLAKGTTSKVWTILVDGFDRFGGKVRTDFDATVLAVKSFDSASESSIGETAAVSIGITFGGVVASIIAFVGRSRWLHARTIRIEREKHPFANAARDALNLGNIDNFEAKMGKIFHELLDDIRERLHNGGIYMKGLDSETLEQIGNLIAERIKELNVEIVSLRSTKKDCWQKTKYFFKYWKWGTQALTKLGAGQLRLLIKEGEFVSNEENISGKENIKSSVAALIARRERHILDTISISRDGAEMKLLPDSKETSVEMTEFNSDGFGSLGDSGDEQQDVAIRRLGNI